MKLLARLSLPFVCLLFGGVFGNAYAEPRNVILIIGDGMDDHQITIARNYLHGAQGRLAMDTMALRSSMQVITIDEEGNPVYVADSANSGTAMATGEITSRGRISTSAGDDTDIPTIAEMASAAGYKTGIVSSASVTDATPAVFGAHINLRFCENPQEMVTDRVDCSKDLKENGGPGSISEQLATSDLDVILGGGMQHFAAQTAGGEPVVNIAMAHGYHLVLTPAALPAAPKDKKLLGLFAGEHLAVRMQGSDARIAEDVDVSITNNLHWSLGSATYPELMTCEPNPAAAETPSILSLTQAAVEHLSHENERGFFLMVESASIDKQAHARNPCGSIGELEQLDEVVQFARDYAAANPGTLIMVTADHSQAAQLVPETSLFNALGIPVFTPGKLARIKTREGGVMGVNYATNSFFASEHTGAAVPFYANEALTGKLPIYIMQTDVFRYARDHLGL